MHAWEPLFKQELTSIDKLAVQPFCTIFENVHVTLGQLFSLSSLIAWLFGARACTLYVYTSRGVHMICLKRGCVHYVGVNSYLVVRSATESVAIGILWLFYHRIGGNSIIVALIVTA